MRRWDRAAFVGEGMDNDVPEVEDQPKKPELRPLIGLADVSVNALPRLHIVVKNKKGELIAEPEVALTALVVSPHGHEIIYLEAVSTSTVTAHSVLACAVENPGSIEWSYRKKGQRQYESGIRIHEPDAPRVADVKLALKGHSGLHHIVIMDRGESFLIARDDETLWMKLRKQMTCPTLSHWGADLMPQVHEAAILLKCESFGLPPGLNVYVLDSEAGAKFDALVGKYVREKGGLN